MAVIHVFLDADPALAGVIADVPITNAGITSMDGKLSTLISSNASILADTATIDTQTAAISTKLPSSVGPKNNADSLSVVDVPNTAFLATAVTAGTAAVPVPATPLANRRTLQYFNKGTVTHFLGGSAVTASTGTPVEPNQSALFQAGPGAILYVITSIAAENGRALEIA